MGARWTSRRRRRREAREVAAVAGGRAWLGRVGGREGWGDLFVFLEGEAVSACVRWWLWRVVGGEEGGSASVSGQGLRLGLDGPARRRPAMALLRRSRPRPPRSPQEGGAAPRLW